MAMLAEPRRKQKWSLNPRGKQWSDDSNKFGQKMLEKMGWTSGKGLGANGQGITEHVKVSHKNDQTGIGFKDKGDQWTQHQVDFNDLLSQLQGTNEGLETVAESENKVELSGQSLELKSKQSRARLHYHKFTRGKDVNKYSAKDLANIFGKKDLREKVGTEKEKVEETSFEPVGSKDNTAGVITIKGGNINEYFKNKMPNFMRKGTNNCADNEGADSDHESQQRVGLGFGSSHMENSEEHSRSGFGFSEKPRKKSNTSSFVFENAALDLNCPEKPQTPKKRSTGLGFENQGLDLDYPEESTTPKMKKISLHIENSVSNVNDSNDNELKIVTPGSSNGFFNPALNLNDSVDDSHNGAEFEISRAQFGLDNNALDLTDEICKRKRVTFNDKVEYNIDVAKKSKKGKAKLDKFEVENDRVKKKSSENKLDIEVAVEGFVNEALDVEMISDEIVDNEVNERKSKKKKKRKDQRVSNLETIEEAPEENKEFDDCQITGEAVILEEGEPNKNVRSKRDCEDLICEDTKQDDNEMSADTPKKKKKKEKKTKKDKEVEAEIEVMEDSVNYEESDGKKFKKKKDKGKEIEVTPAEDVPKKKKKCKKSKREPNATDEGIECITLDAVQQENDKENNGNNDVEIIEVLRKKKKDKKRRKSKCEEASVVSSETQAEQTDETELEVIELNETLDGEKKKDKKRKHASSENLDTPSKKVKHSNTEASGDLENQEPKVEPELNSTQSPWDKKGKKSKQIFKSLFAKAPTLYFNGSNINEIKGYGVDMK